MNNLKKFNNFGWLDFLKNSIELDDDQIGGAINDLMNKDFLDSFRKDDAPLLTSTTGAKSILYGATVWGWTNLDNAAFGAMSKVPYDKSGERAKTADSTTKASGVAETGAIPAGQKPTYALLAHDYAQIVSRFDYSRKQANLVGKDDVIATPEQLRMDRGQEHASALNEYLMANNETNAANATANNAGGQSYLYGAMQSNVMECLDRILSCDDEEDDLGGTHINWYDPYVASGTYDRDSGTTYDAQVVYGDGTSSYQGGSGTFTTDVTLSLGAIDNLIDNCVDAGSKKSDLFFITGRDTLTRWKNLEAPKQRYMNPVYASLSVNGIQTEPGVEAGFQINSYDSVPIVTDVDCPSYTISKIYLVNKTDIFLKVMTPTIYVDLAFPAFSTSGSALAQRLGSGAFFLTELELVAKRYNRSGKLCALK